MKKWFKRNLLYILRAFAGAIAGCLYYQQTGCASGNCMITSKPVNSTLYGTLIGELVFGMFKKITVAKMKSSSLSSLVVTPAFN